jgi:hypothetical protein
MAPLAQRGHGRYARGISAVIAEYQFEENDAFASGASISSTEDLLGVGLYYTGRSGLLVGLGGGTELNVAPFVGLDRAGMPESCGAPSAYFGQW